MAFVVDDVLPPWQPRMVEVRADAELLAGGGATIGPQFGPELMRLHPRQIVSLGLNGPGMSNRKVGG